MDETEAQTAPLAPVLTLNPADRAIRAGITGVPLVIGEAEWLLPHAPTYPAFDAVRDQLFEDQVISGAVSLDAVHPAAFALLLGNYRLAPDEARDLLLAADPTALATAVYDALIPAQDPPRGVSDWIASSLVIGGLDPAKVPGAMVPHILHQLQAAGRIMPLAEFADACVVAAKRRAIMEKTGVPWGPNGRSPAP